MNWLDYAIIIMVVISMVISIWRGFVREALSVVAWVLAVWLAINFSPYLAAVLPDSITANSIRLAIAFASLFVVTLFLGSVVNYLISQVIQGSGLSGTDRMLGMIFGVIRGLVVVEVLVLLAGMTPIPQDGWWQQSFFVPYFQAVAMALRGFLPESVANSIQYY